MTSQPSPTVPTTEDTPPFTPEQLAWIDRFVAARQGQTPHRPPGTDPPALVSTSPGPLLTTAASQSGKLPPSAWSILRVRCLTPAAGRATIAQLAALCFYSASTVRWSLWLDTMQAGPIYLLPSTYGQGRVPLMPHACRAVVPPYATHLHGRVPLMPHTCRAVFPSCHNTCRDVFPSCHTLAGPCSPPSLVPRPAPSFLSLAVRLSGRGPGTFSHVSDVTDRANYANVGVM